jgi:hypothetical protein
MTFASTRYELEGLGLKYDFNVKKLEEDFTKRGRD